MVVIESLPSATRPKEIIEHTFNVFCGAQKTMDEVGFAKFCESSKRVLASDARNIFCAVVQNVHNGMDLSEFKDALTLLVKFGKNSANQQGMDRKASSDNQSPKAVKPAGRRSTVRRSTLQSRRNRIESDSSNSSDKDSSTSSESPSTFRWSPLDIGDSINREDSPSRPIRWCPAELEE